MKVYQNLQAMRGGAALMVLVEHALNRRLGMDLDELTHLFANIGNSGVDIFFVISGFIICRTLSTSRVESPVRSAMTFAYRRCARVYPVYWCVLLFAVCASLWVPMSGPSMPMSSWTSLMTLTTPANWYVPPAWTLAFEMYFYLGASLVLAFASRHIYQAIFAWMTVQAVIAVLFYAHDVATNPLIVEFGFGCLLAFLIGRGCCRFAITSFVASLPLFTIGAVISARFGPVEGWQRVATFGLGGALLVYAFLAAELRGWVLPPAMGRVGDASYSIYVWHWPALTVFAVASETSGLIDATPMAARPLLVVAWIGATLVLAGLSFVYIERPFLNRIRHVASDSRVAST